MIKDNEDFSLHTLPPPLSGSTVFSNLLLSICTNHTKVDWKGFRRYELVKNNIALIYCKKNKTTREDIKYRIYIKFYNTVVSNF